MAASAEPALCMVLKGYPRVSETFISNEILNLEALGFKVHIISMRHPREAFTHASVKQIKAQVDYLPSTISGNLGILIYHNLIWALKHPGRYFKAAGKAIRRWRRTHKTATLKHLLQAGVVANKCLPGKNIVHFQAHFAHSPTSVALFSSMLTGVPFSFFAHAKDIYTSNRAQLAEKIDMAQFVVTCTQYNQRYLSEIKNSSRTPLHCVYHGISLEYFKNSRKPPEPEPPYRLLTVARMTEKKGLDTIYQALAILKNRGVQFHHTLIGEGDDHEKVVSLITSLGLENDTTLAGTLTHEDVISYYADSHLFVLGCRVAKNGDRDGIPNVMAESMAMKLPVAATDVSGLPEFLKDGQTGLSVPSNDPEKLADAMLHLCRDTNLRQKVTQNARREIEDRFNNKKLIIDLARIYARAIPALQIDPETLPDRR
jgi:glycosyltransferase involved in cell wall biosynthesis